MSGMTASNLGASNIAGDVKKLEHLQESMIDHNQPEEKSEENDDPNSLENRRW